MPKGSDSTFDLQFWLILSAVAVFQVCLVSYAWSLPRYAAGRFESLEPAIADAVILMDRQPEPPKTPDAPPLSPPKPTEHAPVPNAPAPKSSSRSTASKAGDRDPAPIDVSKRGLLGVIGKAATIGEMNADRSSPVQDIFQEDMSKPLDEAFTDISGVELADPDSLQLDQDRPFGPVPLGPLSTGPSAKLRPMAKREAPPIPVIDDLDAPPIVDGQGLSPEMIRRAMRAKIKALKSCYESALKLDPQLRGKMLLKFSVLETGRTEDIALVSISAKSSKLSSCVQKRARYWRFPKPSGPVEVEYPLFFSSAAR